MNPALSLNARKQQLVRDAIWDAATGLFADQGYDETTVDDIARLAGVSRRSYFRYFASKGDLLAHGMVNYGAEITAAIDACPRNHTLPEVFRETVLQVARKSTDHPRARTIMTILARHPAARAAEMSRFAEVQDQVTKAFARRCKSGDKDLTARMLAGMTLQVTGVAVRLWFERGPSSDIEEAVDHAFATLGLLVCGGPSQPAAAGRRERKQ